MSSSVPAAPSQANLNVASYASPLGFSMSIPGQANSCVTLSSASLTAVICAIENTAMISRYGAYAAITSARESPPGWTPCLRSSAGSWPSAPASAGAWRSPSSGSAGRHTRSSATIAVTETSAAMMSVSSMEM